MRRDMRARSHVFATLLFSVSTAWTLAKPAGAQVATTVTFNALAPGAGVTFLTNCFTDNGFSFTAVGVSCTGATAQNAFLAAGSGEPLFGGGASASLLLNTGDASLIDVRRVDNARFGLLSIRLAPFDAAATTVLFTGTTVGGPVTQSFSLLGTQAGFQTFTFGALFASLSTVRIQASNQFGEPLVKLDDFATQSVVPEPSTTILLIVGLTGLATVASRRGRRT